MHSRQGIGLAGPGGRTPDVETGHRPFRAEDHRAAGGAVRVGGVADEDVGEMDVNRGCRIHDARYMMQATDLFILKIIQDCEFY